MSMGLFGLSLCVTLGAMSISLSIAIATCQIINAIEGKAKTEPK